MCLSVRGLFSRIEKLIIGTNWGTTLPTRNELRQISQQYGISLTAITVA